MSRASDNEAKWTGPVAVSPELAPAHYCDPVIEFYKKDVDRAALRENLKLTGEQRLLKAQSLSELMEKRRRTGKTAEHAHASKAAAFLGRQTS